MISEIPMITCPDCRKESDALSWRERPLIGELPADEFQCPTAGCGFAFKREQTSDRWHPVRCVRIPARL